MNKIIYTLLFFSVFSTSLWSHSLLLNVFDNKDNTIQIEALFSTGEPAGDAKILIQSLVDGKILYKKRVPLEGELTIQIPKESYEIILDGGPGHIIIEKGIPPIEGFNKIVTTQETNFSTTKKEEKSKDYRNIIIIYGLLISFLLFFITMIVSIKNTKKLIKVLKESKA